MVLLTTAPQPVRAGRRRPDHRVPARSRCSRWRADRHRLQPRRFCDVRPAGRQRRRRRRGSAAGNRLVPRQHADPELHRGGRTRRRGLRVGQLRHHRGPVGRAAPTPTDWPYVPTGLHALHLLRLQPAPTLLHRTTEVPGQDATAHRGDQLREADRTSSVDVRALAGLGRGAVPAVGFVLALVLRYRAALLDNPDTWFHLTLGERFRGDWSLAHPGSADAVRDQRLGADPVVHRGGGRAGSRTGSGCPGSPGCSARSTSCSSWPSTALPGRAGGRCRRR